jgi:hypothetical protein
MAEWFVSHYLHGGDPPSPYSNLHERDDEEVEAAEDAQDLIETERLRERRRNGLA